MAKLYFRYGAMNSGKTTALLATFGRVWTQAEDQETLAAFDPVVLPAVS